MLATRQSASIINLGVSWHIAKCFTQDLIPHYFGFKVEPLQLRELLVESLHKFSEFHII